MPMGVRRRMERSLFRIRGGRCVPAHRPGAVSKRIRPGRWIVRRLTLTGGLRPLRHVPAQGDPLDDRDHAEEDGAEGDGGEDRRPQHLGVLPRRPPAGSAEARMS